VGKLRVHQIELGRVENVHFLGKKSTLCSIAITGGEMGGKWPSQEEDAKERLQTITREGCAQDKGGVGEQQRWHDWFRRGSEIFERFRKLRREFGEAPTSLDVGIFRTMSAKDA